MAKRGRKRKRLFTLTKSRKSYKVAAKPSESLKDDDSKVGEMSTTCPPRPKEGQAPKIILQQPPPSGSFKIEILDKNSGILINNRGRANLSPTSPAPYKKFVYVTPKRFLDSEGPNEMVLNKRNKIDTNGAPNVQIVPAVPSGHQNYHEIPRGGNSDTVIINVSQPPVNNIDASPSLFIQNGSHCVFPASTTQPGTPTARFPEEREVQLHIEEDEAMNFSEHLSFLDEMEANDSTLTNSTVNQRETVVQSKDPAPIVATSNNFSVSNSFSTPKQNTQRVFKLIPDNHNILSSVSTVRHIGPTVTPTTLTSPSIVAFNSATTRPMINKYSVTNIQKPTNVVLSSPVSPHAPSLQTLSVARTVAAGAITVPNLVLKPRLGIKHNPVQGSSTPTPTITRPTITPKSILRAASTPIALSVYNSEKTDGYVLQNPPKIVTKIIPAATRGITSSITTHVTSLSSSTLPSSLGPTKSTMCLPV